jgi:uncharacterized protein YceH (UPF0502 family)
VRKQPKQPGSREHRWAHLLCGGAPMPAAAEQDRVATSLELRVERLEAEVGELRAALRALTNPE